MNRYLNLTIHQYAVLKNGERIAFFSNLTCAAEIASWRNGGGVENIATGQTWARYDCLEIAGSPRKARIEAAA